MKNAAPLLALIAALPFLLAVGYVVGDRHAPPPAQPAWKYSAVQRYQTAQLGVVVLCQGKTTSLPFAAHKHATPGDVQVVTCRAVKAETLERQPEPPA